MTRPIPTPAYFNEFGVGTLPAHMGIVVTDIGERSLSAQFVVAPHLLAPNGFLHAGSVVSLADTACGYGCVANLPEGAANFTTIELKSNHLGTAREGMVLCTATLAHGGRTTQVWDAVVTEQASGKTIALFRCTQMILYPR
ncbi:MULTISPECIES: PaaI family thioesterase [unclassified Janthinobacterium]|uniref:PaaI family thioesterase n=1 Tax=unclassified Janthinobacterium TaxID=2610881 RepID=UPI00034B900C|nr:MULTISPECIES: PaaI family thioesterase [unclassified Janthinobacterium]MEC5160100.1 1,4-dihydroxy-2-naphthoyl-CoA hydrolase [Janthinobacterium sp. CG_S6]